MPLSVPVRTLAPPLQYDNRADDLTKEGMLKGIEQAAAFILFLSSGVLERPYCQLEIRHAMALKKPIVLLHGEIVGAAARRVLCVVHFTPARSLVRSFVESDARYGSFDFRAAHAAAPIDLQQLLDNTESLPFRRRGYERDGMLKCVRTLCPPVYNTPPPSLRRLTCSLVCC